MTTEEVIEKAIKPIAKDGFSDALEILQLIAILEAQNTNHVNKGLNEAGAGRAAATVKNALITRLTVLVTRCYSKSKDGDAHARQAFDIIAKDDRVSAELAKRNKKGVLKNSQDAWASLLGDNRLHLIKHFRDKFTAHLGKPEKDTPLPKYNELFSFAIETTEILETLANVSGANTHRLSDWNGEITESSSEFWKPWAHLEQG
jgi:hypothetical protein